MLRTTFLSVILHTSLVVTRGFSSTNPALQRPDHALYIKVDWEIVRSGKYAVVDPFDPHSVKYLTNREYIIDSRVAMSNDASLIVLATPKDHPISFIRSDPSDPKNSPPKGEEDLEGAQRFESKRGRIAMLRLMFSTPFLADLKSTVKKEAKSYRSQRKLDFDKTWAKEFAEVKKAEMGTEALKPSRQEGVSKPVRKVGKRVPGGSKKTAADGPDTLGYLDATRVRFKDRKEDAYESMVVLSEGNLIQIILKWGKLLHFRLFGLTVASGYKEGLVLFANHLLWIYKHNGVQQVILRLKVYLHVTYAYLAKSPLKHTRELKTPVRLVHGLPAAFPASTRFAIRARSVQAIRAWTSLCGMYKGLKGVWGRPDYSDIIQPDITVGGNQNILHLKRYCSDMFVNLLPGYKAEGGQIFQGFPIPVNSFKTKDVYVSTKGGPNGKSLTSAHWDLIAWLVLIGHQLGYFKDRTILITVDNLKSSEHPFKEFIRWVTLNLDVIYPLVPWGELMLITKDIRFKHAITKLVFALEDLDLSTIADSPGNPITSGYSDDNKDRDETGVRGSCPEEFEGKLEPLWCRTGPQGGLNVAQLVSLYEPAGKVRNIVMVDWLTQQVLKPFHDLLFDLLRGLPTDATFDQDGSVEAFSLKDYTYIASFDLKAATESISQSIYSAVLEPIFGIELAALFIKLLADRDVAIAPDAEASKWGTHVRYNRGQPMGALGSWASMALVHHALVQFCAYTAGVFDSRMIFRDYLVLGDDIVIANKLVADMYLMVTSDLGITVGLPKSFVSNDAFFNFANQSFLNKHNISPISFREEISARSPSTRIESAFRMLRRGFLSVTSNGWLSPLLRAVLPKQIYRSVTVARRAGRLDHAVHAVLTATFGALSRMGPDEITKAHLDKLQGLSVFGYFRLLKANVSLFSEPLQTTLGRGPDLDKDPGLNEAVLGLLHKEANILYGAFLKVRPILADWKAKANRAERDGRILNPEAFFGPSIGYLAPIMVSYPTFGQKMDELLLWESKYRRVLKTILVTYSLQPITIELFEFTAGSLETLWQTLDTARRELPINPELILGEIPTQGAALSQDSIFTNAASRFTRFAHLIELSNAASTEPAFSQRHSLAGAMDKVILEPHVPSPDPILYNPVVEEEILTESD